MAMNRLFVSTVLAAVLAATAVLAQQSGQEPQGTDPLLQNREMSPQDSGTILEKQPMESQAVKFVAAQEKSDWLASSLIGRTVYNPEQETLGDISDVLVNENGQVMAVLIGVGGFLGIGGKDVGVNFESLQFTDRKDIEAASSQSPLSNRAQSTSPKTSAGRPAIPGQAPGLLAEGEPRSAKTKNDADHSTMIIVLNATKEELSAAPAFVLIGTVSSPEASGPPARSPGPGPKESQ